MKDNPSKKKNFLKPLFVFGALLGLGFYFSRAEFVQVIKLKNGRVFAGRYRVQEENWDHPRLQLLRTREKLDQVIAGGNREFDKIILLRKWAHDQWKGNRARFYYPPWDAVEILDLARQ